MSIIVPMVARRVLFQMSFNDLCKLCSEVNAAEPLSWPEKLRGDGPAHYKNLFEYLLYVVGLRIRHRIWSLMEEEPIVDHLTVNIKIYAQPEGQPIKIPDEIVL